MVKQSPTRSASSLSILCVACIRLIKSVSANAVRHLSLSLSSISTANVFREGNGLKVAGINTAMHTAKMIKLQSFRYRIAERFKANAMRILMPMISICQAYSEAPISLCVSHSSPKPASTVRLWQYILHKSFDVLRGAHSYYFTAHLKKAGI